MLIASLIGIALLIVIGLRQLQQTNKGIIIIMKTQADLDAAIAALPAAIEAAVTTAVQPIITALQNAQGQTDFTNEVSQLQAMPAAIAQAAATALTPAAPATGTSTQS